MKKCMKILAAAGGIFAGVGLIFLIAGLILSGGSIDWGDVFSVNGKDLLKYNIRLGDDSDDQNVSMVVDSGVWKCTTVSGVRNLDIEMAVGDLQISTYTGKDIKVYVDQSDSKTEVVQDGDELEIRVKNRWWEDKDRKVRIRIPEDYVWKEVDLDLKAANGLVESLKAKELSVIVGAASLEMTGKVEAEISEWSLGVGSIDVKQLASDDISVQCAAGEVLLGLDGEEEDYFLDGEVSAGSLSLGNNSWDGVGQDVQYGSKNAKHRIDVECAAGNIEITMNHEDKETGGIHHE
ncbi:MAG: hypothetical protein ACI4R7_04445 [Oliverpabstia sp.]